MILLYGRATSSFIEKNGMNEVLGLFVLFLVGIILEEGGHFTNNELGDNMITPMSETSFYFITGVMVFTHIVQSKYLKKLWLKGEI